VATPAEIHLSKDGGNTYEAVALSRSHGNTGYMYATDVDVEGVASTRLAHHGTGQIFHKSLKVADGAILAEGEDNCSVMRVKWHKEYAPQSTTESGLHNGANLLFVDGEIMQFRTTAKVAPFGENASINGYKHYNLLRGRRGTENKIIDVRGGTITVELNERRSVFVPLNYSDIGRTIYFKCITKGMTLAESTIVSFVFNGESLMPFAPSNVTVMRNASEDCVISWNRRSRSIVRLMGVKHLPYGEDTDNYEIDIMSPTGSPRTVLRTIKVSGATTATYTASQQTADGLTLGNAVFLRVYQMSNAVGRGQTNTVTAQASSTPNWVSPTTYTT
tara:strand:+ start:4172 stop:5167 length:996 start_codon:yes stop_codon:yes gene_type:complete